MLQLACLVGKQCARANRSPGREQSQAAAALSPEEVVRKTLEGVAAGKANRAMKRPAAVEKNVRNTRAATHRA